MAAAPAVESMVDCVSCGLPNRANSKFCKKCGGALSAVVQAGQPFGFAMHDAQQQGFSHGYDETRAVNIPVFTPPSVSGAQYSTTNNNKSQLYILTAAIVIGVSIIAGAIIYNTQSGSNKTDSPGETVANNTKASVATPAPPRNSAPASNGVKPADTISPFAGRTGRLVNNQHIRAGSNKYSADLGVHYDGARIEVLDHTTFTNEDGSPAVWYRVKVLSDGFDSNTGRGWGNDRNGFSGQASREGWMSAKNIELD